MSINNNILNSSGFHQKNNHVRPVSIDRVETANKRLQIEQEKQAIAGSSSCPKGTTWHKKLKICVNNDAVNSLRNLKIDYAEKVAKNKLRLALENFQKD